MAITINGSGITSANIAVGTITASDISASEVKNLKSGRKNLIINGGFDVWQRGTSFSGLSPYSYFADRWQCAISTTCSRSTDTPTDEGFNYSAKLEAGSGGNILRMMLEDSYRLLGSNSFTFSFWIKGSVASTGGMDVGDQQIKSFSITTSWTKITQNFTEISTSAHGGTANDYFDITSSVAGDFYITGVQLELGSVATDFEHRSYGEELALCQRYYEILWDSTKHVNTAYLFKCNGTTSSIAPYMFQVEKRAAATIMYTGFPTMYPGGVVTAFSPDSSGTKGGRIMMTPTNAVVNQEVGHMDIGSSSAVADAEL